MSVDSLAAVLRAASFLALFQAVGAAIFLTVFDRKLRRSARPIRRLCGYASVIALVLVFAHYALEAGRLGGEIIAVADADLQKLVLHSPTAVSAALRLFGLSLVAIALRSGGFNSSIAWAGITAALSAFAFVGHTAAHPLSLVLQALLLLHVAVAAFWFGSLQPMVLVLTLDSQSTASSVIDGFSQRAVWLVPALFVAGAGLLILLTRLDRSVLDLPYGRTLAFKLGTFALLMLLAILNRSRYAPRLCMGDPAAASALRWSIRCEIFLIGAVLIATAVMTSLFSPE